MKITVKFTTVLVSSNTNAFGLYQAILVNEQGDTFKIHANSLNIPKKGQILDVPFRLLYNQFGNPLSEKVDYQWSQLGFEVCSYSGYTPKNTLNDLLRPNKPETTTGALSRSSGFPRGMKGVTNFEGLPLPAGC